MKFFDSAFPDLFCKPCFHKCKQFFCRRYFWDIESFLAFPIRYSLARGKPFDVFSLQVRKAVFDRGRNVTSNGCLYLIYVISRPSQLNRKVPVTKRIFWRIQSAVYHGSTHAADAAARLFHKVQMTEILCRRWTLGAGFVIAFEQLADSQNVMSLMSLLSCHICDILIPLQFRTHPFSNFRICVR